MERERWILGINVSDRLHAAERVQYILTKFGGSIRTRLGLHDVTDDYCDKGGMILLELTGNKDEFQKLVEELKKVEGVEVQHMIFTQG